ncbi:MAG: hypothetical protein ACFFE5_07440 [Candidatus Thorarchaeota archaeon]
MDKNSKFYFALVLLIFSISFSLQIIFATAQESLPLRDLRPGWDAYPIYEIPHPPGANCIGKNGDLYYVDNLHHILMKMDENGIHSEVISTGNLSFADIEYQPNHNRLLGVTMSGFYTITPSQITLLKNYTYFGPISELAINSTNDYFYCGSLFENTDIFYFDADGNNLSTIVSNVQGCSQIILNSNQTLLYYTQTYIGTITQLNLTSFTTKVMRTGIGLPDTQEVIGIGVDDNDTLYSMTADGNERGFYKYTNNSYEFIMASKVGMGQLTWFPKLKTFIAAVSFGGCLVNYDPLKSVAEILTPIVNSHTLIETRDGKILYVIDDTIYQINQSGPTVFCQAPNNTSVNNLIVDVDNNIFAALLNDSVSIYQVSHAGTMTSWFKNEILEITKTMVYDEKNHNIVLITNDALQNESNVYRIPLGDPMNYSKVLTMPQTTKTNGVVDEFGNIFIYEAYNNSLYKIPDGSMQKQLITTEFANFTDIYGPNAVVEPSLGYCSVEQGILIGRNDDLHIWLLEENRRTTFAVNNRGIDNSAIFQNHNNEIICTQSTLIIKMIHNEPSSPTTIGVSSLILLTIFIAVPSIVYYFQKRREFLKK